MIICVTYESCASCKNPLICLLPFVTCGKKSTVALTTCTFETTQGKVAADFTVLIFWKSSIRRPIQWPASKRFAGSLDIKKSWIVLEKLIFTFFCIGWWLVAIVIRSVVTGWTKSHCCQMQRLWLTNDLITRWLCFDYYCTINLEITILSFQCRQTL